LIDTEICSDITTGVNPTVTANTSHFQRIQQLGYALILANWRI
jgi:hypothetical protein